VIRQLPITVKTATATLTVAEFGDVVVDATAIATITLPAPYPGLWYRVSNVCSYTITIEYDSATITTIKQNEAVLLLADDTSDWYYTQGIAGITKAQVEAVLTGEISSHTHAYIPEGGSLNLSITNVTSAYSVTASDYTINCDGNFTVTLTTAVSIAGRIYVVKNSGLGSITVAAQAGEDIDGSSTQILPSKSSITLQSDGSNWIII
jgi:hypothetical protein